MREAIGGVGLMHIVLIFLAVYIGLMAIVINYGRVFRVKNSLISYIENNEGFKTKDSLPNLKRYATEKLGYQGDKLQCCYIEGNNNTKYFNVAVYMSFSLPLVNQNIDVKVSGETSAIKSVSKKSNTIGIDPCK